MAAFRFVFTAEDYDLTRAFYTQKLGLSVVTSWDDHGQGTIVAAADGQIEFFAAGPDPAATVAGCLLAWEVEDARSRHEELQGAGVPVVAGLADQPWGHRNFTIVDPNGVLITMFQVIDPE